MNFLKGNQHTAIANSAAETTVVTAPLDPTVTNCPYGLILANSGASASKVDIRDTTGGTIRATFEVPAGDTRGFMLPTRDALGAPGSVTPFTPGGTITAQCATATSNMDVTVLYLAAQLP